MIKAAIYARVSTDSQSENSTTDQIRECQAYATKEGWAIHGTYVDEAISGSDVSRAEYSRLKADALAGRFQYIIVDDLSRIGRDMPEFARLYQDLTDMGVHMIGVADGIDTSKSSAKIPVYLKGIMNELYLDDMKAKVVRGLKGQILRGYSTGGRVYGYKTEPIYDSSGELDKFGRRKRHGCKILIDNSEAENVRHIFSMRKSGLGYRAIAKVLNEEGILGPRADTATGNKLWSPGTIRSMLLNKKYIGVWEYNKIRWIKKRVPGKRRSMSNSPSELVKFTSEDLRIVSDDIFYAVNSKIAKKQKRNSPGRKKYLLSGLLKCAECGGSLIVQNARDYSCYICGNARNKGPMSCKNTVRVSREKIEEVIQGELQRVLLNDSIIVELAERTRKRIESLTKTHRQNPGQLKRDRRKLKGQIDNLLKAIEGGDYSESIKQRIEQREQELKAIEAAIKKSQETPARLARVTSEWIQSRLFRIREMIGDRSDKILLLRNELKNLFPGNIAVRTDKGEGGTKVFINCDASPLNLLRAGDTQLCLASPRGFEPLFSP